MTAAQNMPQSRFEKAIPLLSFVIPVYNGSETIGGVVDDILRQYNDCEIILVNDGSGDNSEQVCADLVDMHSNNIHFVHLSRNFGEHSAVLAGLTVSTGRYVAVLDDDGQNPPGEIQRMLDTLIRARHDVVYGRYRRKKHHFFRNLGSRFNDWVATRVLGKPPHIYLSSFKVMDRFLVNEVLKYKGAFPYIDGLIFRATGNIGQIDVEHKKREAGTSNYTFIKLVKLWLNMFLNFSVAPLRLSIVIGSFVALVSFAMMFSIIFEKLWINPDLPLGLPSILCAMGMFFGVQLLLTGMLGEYIGRMFLDGNNTPQFVIRYVKKVDSEG